MYQDTLAKEGLLLQMIELIMSEDKTQQDVAWFGAHLLGDGGVHLSLKML